MKPRHVTGLVLILSAALAALPGGAADTNSLRVVVKPSKTEVRVMEKFRVELRVENPAGTNQTVRVMSCSWDEEWKSSNTNISWLGWPCPANARIPIEIPPGGAYTNQLDMFIPGPVPRKTLAFQMGFTSIGSETTFWSDEVKLNILPPAK
jgi:hypothetical protein